MFLNYFKQPLLAFWTIIVILLVILGIVLLSLGSAHPQPSVKNFQTLSPKEIIQIRQNLALLPALPNENLPLWKKDFLRILAHDNSPDLSPVSKKYLKQLTVATKALTPSSSTLTIQSQKQALYSLGDALINLEIR